jgi:hypothetical protein
MKYFLDLFHMQNGIFQKHKTLHIPSMTFSYHPRHYSIITGITHIIKDPSPELPCPTWNRYYINIYPEGKIPVKHCQQVKHVNKILSVYSYVHIKNLQTLQMKRRPLVVIRYC